jgi:transposase
MAAPYQVDLRRRILRAYTHGEGSVRALAKRFAVAPGTVQNYLNLFRQTGSLAPRPHGGGVKPRLDSQRLKDVYRLIQEMPEATMLELAKALADRYHIEVSRQTMARALQQARRDAEGTRSRDRA